VNNYVLSEGKQQIKSERRKH